MNAEIFRKKSLDKIKSPDSLNDYICVSNPGIWLLLVSIIVLLAGACVWGVCGKIESTVSTIVYAENEIAACYIAEEDISAVQAGMKVKFDGMEAVVSSTAEKDEQWYICLLESEQPIPDGLYDGKIVISTYKPIDFVFN